MQRVGETKIARKLVKKVAVRPVDLARLDAAQEITAQPDAVERAFMARELVQCTLPHSDPGNVPTWTRRNGDLMLAVQPAIDTQKGELIGYPFGNIPRLLLYWIVTEATRTKSRRLYPGRNLSAFMRELGLNPTNGTGKRSDKARLEDGAKRLFGSRVTLQKFTEYEHATREQFLSMEVASASDLWWSNSSPDQGVLWDSWIDLGEKFFHAITAATVPIDLRIVKAIKKSVLALDLYAWICHRAYTVNKSGKAARISWVALADQFGSDYENPEEFGRYARKYLNTIKVFWREFDNGKPGLLLDFVKGGLVLKPGSLLSVQEALPTSRQELQLEESTAKITPMRKRKSG